MIGMSVNDMHRWDMHKDWVKDDNFDSQGIAYEHRTLNEKLLQESHHRQLLHLKPLVRIAVQDGSIRWDSGSKYQKNCLSYVQKEAT